MMPHVLRFFDDYGSGWLWAGDDAAFAAFDVGPLDDRLIPQLAPATLAEARALSALNADTLNMDDPMTPLPLTPAFCAAFNARVAALFVQMQADLGPGFRLIDETTPLEPQP